MSRNLLAIFFSIFFLSLTTVPTIVMVVDSSIDVSIFFDISEEEEEKESKKNKEFEVFVIDLDTELEDLKSTNSKEDLAYKFKTYPKPHLNLISPPPEFIS
nr:hypothetical protein [uncultured Psychroserpens sp.]